MLNSPRWHVYQDDEYHLIANSCCNEKIYFWTHKYGYIRKKNDGRYEWFARPTSWDTYNWECTTYKQGVCKTIQEAKSILEAFFIENPGSLMEFYIG